MRSFYLYSRCKGLARIVAKILTLILYELTVYIQLICVRSSNLSHSYYLRYNIDKEDLGKFVVDIKATELHSTVFWV